MIAMRTKASGPTLARDLVVTLNSEPIHGHGPEGPLGPSNLLGPGFIRRMGGDGKVQVHWIERNFDAWMDPGDLRVQNPATRLISIYHCNSEGQRTFEQHKLATSKGLQYNWTVEILPEDVIRAVRSDGSAWTFNWFPVLHSIEVLHTVGFGPIEDDDAEARTAVEIALGLNH
jgi:hypothetical protein